MAFAIAFKNIQGLFTIIEQQRADLDTLVLIIIDKIGCIGPLAVHKLDVLINVMHVKSGEFSVSMTSVSKLLMGMYSCVGEIATYLEENLCQLIFCDIGMVYVTVCDKVKDVALHKDSSNKETHTQLPTVFPHGMLKLCPAELLHKFCDQRNILYHLFPLPTHIEVIGD